MFGFRARLVMMGILLLSSGMSFAKVVNFPDPGLDDAVRLAIGRPSGDILDTDLVGLTTLDASSRKIVDLYGLQYCTGLTDLDLSSNLIVDLSVLDGLTNLEKLRLYGNRISNITALTGLTQLDSLSLNDNEITNLGALASLTNLYILDLGGNGVTDVSSLVGLTNLHDLNLVSNQIVSISALVANSGIGTGDSVYLNDNPLSQDAACRDIPAMLNRGASVQATSVCNDPVVVFPDPALSALIRSAIAKPTGDILESDLLGLTTLIYLRGDIVSLSGIEHCVNLTRFDIEHSNVVDVSPLAGLTNLTRLDLLSNQIADISPLAGLTNLTRLDLGSNQIADISPLAGLTNLTSLDLGSNQIADISPLAGLTNLTSLDLGSNQIADISPLAGLTNLNSLRLGYNRVSDISALANMTGLFDLTLGSNHIADISPLAGLTNLTSLRLFDNQIVDIGRLASLTNLYDLQMDNNQIADIGPLAGLTKLSLLGLDNNQIVDISALVANAGLEAPAPNEVDIVFLDHNPLSQEAACRDITTLRARGVFVSASTACLDADNDGMPDYWETRFRLNPAVDDAAEDPDGDNLSNLQEYQAGSNPFTLGNKLVFYVDKDNTAGPWDGATWGTAFQTIQEGIDAADAAGTAEVWVAGGVYDEARANDTGSLVLKEGVAVYGGFVGIGGNEISRDVRGGLYAYYTTIDGQAARAGQPAYHVVVGVNNASLDGFTVTGGWANGGGNSDHGAGMFNDGASPTVANCLFIGNRAAGQGAGMCNWQSSSPNVSDCTFAVNIAGYYGGGMMNYLGSSPSVVRCHFQNNETTTPGDNWGAGVASMLSSPYVVNSVFSGNQSLWGAAVGDAGGGTTVVNCTMTGNVAPSGHVLFSHVGSSVTVLNCIIWGNSAPQALLVMSGGQLSVTYSDIQGGWPGLGNINAAPLFVDAAVGYFDLTLDSLCIDTGTDAGAPAADFHGTPRPNGIGVDMGAFEYVWADTDGDGMPDVWETRHGLDPNVDDASLDPDGDGLTNFREFGARTDPQAADSDSDDLADGQEVDAYHSNPLRADTDGDTLSDGQEVHVYHTDPILRDTDGDGFLDATEVEKGTNPLDPASNPTLPQYTLGTATELLDAAFYAGDASDGSNAAGRFVLFGRPSNDGARVAFTGVNAATYRVGLFVVNVGEPSSWRRIIPDQAWSPAFPIYWAPDDRSLIIPGRLIDIATGNIALNVVHGFNLPGAELSVTTLPQNNWMCTYYNGGTSGDLALLPILLNGREDLSRSPVYITKNLRGAEARAPEWPHLSSDGSMLTFFQYAGQAAGAPDLGDIYVIPDVQTIAHAPLVSGTIESTLAVSSLYDSKLFPIRTTESDNFAATPCFSQDKSLVFWTEDFNKKFRNNDFFATMALADFDVMLSFSDGSGPDIRLQRAGNQFAPVAFPGGVRLLYVSDVGGVTHLLLSTLEVAGAVPLDAQPLPEGGTTAEIGGQPVTLPFVLTQNAVQMTTPLVVPDASGTSVTLPAQQVVNFPAGAPQQIQILTPINPVSVPELPPEVDAVPVVREFGPEGTQFYPPIRITISYTDAEIVGMDESSLRVFMFNPETGIYDIEVTAGLVRDLAHNTITFPVEHFSKYGLAGKVAEDVTSDIASSLGKAQYNRRTEQNSFEVTLTNNGGSTLTAPLTAIITGISSPTVSVANGDGMQGYDAYFDLSALAPEGLAPGGSVAFQVVFNNPTRERFTFGTTLYAVR